MFELKIVATIYYGFKLDDVRLLMERNSYKA